MCKLSGGTDCEMQKFQVESAGTNGVSITCDGTKITFNSYEDSSCKTIIIAQPAPFAAGTCSSGKKLTCRSGNAAGSSASANSLSGGNSQSNAFKNTFGLLGALMGLALL